MIITNTPRSYFSQPELARWRSSWRWLQPLVPTDDTKPPSNIVDGGYKPARGATTIRTPFAQELAMGEPQPPPRRRLVDMIARRRRALTGATRDRLLRQRNFRRRFTVRLERCYQWSGGDGARSMRAALCASRCAPDLSSLVACTRYLFTLRLPCESGGRQSGQPLVLFQRCWRIMRHRQ
jgi:hypothetical protein